MKRLFLFLIALLPFLSSYAGDGDKHLTFNVGAMAPYTLDATIGYEHPIGHGNAIEVFGEIGDHWRTPVCHNFWKDYFWDGGVAYKHRIARFKNGRLRATGGMQCGMVKRDVFFGLEIGLEYNYVFSNSWELSIREKNTVNFLHGDVFRAGIMIGLKIPL